MPSRVVKHPNGLLAVFSTVVDDFTMYNCTEAELREYWVGQRPVVGRLKAKRNDEVMTEGSRSKKRKRTRPGLTTSQRIRV